MGEPPGEKPVLGHAFVPLSHMTGRHHMNKTSQCHCCFLVSLTRCITMCHVKTVDALQMMMSW